MYCNNCGEKGHVFRTCKDPIISCGIIFLRGIYEPLVLPTNPKELSVLMVRRKDSMSYVEFIRGKYDPSDIDYVSRQISNMTIQEQTAIKTQPFEDLWNKLWNNAKPIDTIEYEIARDKFNAINKDKIISENPSKFSEPEWGFPKGRRIRGETDIQCAMREFFEETNIPNEAYTIHEDIIFTETFIGTNNVQYKHVYFVATLKDSSLINQSRKLTATQRREVSAVEWKTLLECRKITRPHYIQRKKMISEIEQTVSLVAK